MTLRRAVMLLGLVLFAAQEPQAAADPAASWQAGVDAFAEGDIASALTYFKGARDGGQAGPAVHYNIAVCEYELGDYEAARQTFAMIAARFPTMRGLAEYNVGLAERRRGNPAAAQRSFVAAWYASDDPKVRALAVSQLTELARDPPDDRYASISITVGHDDNVALRDRLGLPAGASAESPLAEVFATLNVPSRHVPGLEFDGAIYAITYPEADEFDQAELRAGLLHTHDTTDWKFQAGLHVVAGTLDGSRFNDELNTNFRATWFASDAASVELRFRYDEIRGTEASFDGIDGSRRRADFRYRWNRLPHYLVVRAGVEDNDRRDARISPTRRRLQANYFYRLDDRWEIEVEAASRASEYDNAAAMRDEDLSMVALGASCDIAEHWAVSVRYRYSENDSSDPLFSYKRHQVTVGLRYQFQP